MMPAMPRMVVMVMFIQAFRYAYEPFIFAQNKEKGTGKLQAYSDAMKYFLIFALFIFLGVMFMMPAMPRMRNGDEYRSMSLSSRPLNTSGTDMMSGSSSTSIRADVIRLAKKI